jgi:hypothetical protein
MKAKIIRNNTGKKYWDKYIGKIYPIVDVTTNAVGETYYKLDMTEDEDGYRIWETGEIEVINDEEVKQND